MVQFHFTVTSDHIFHVKPVGELADLARSYAPSVITVTRGGDTVRATQHLRLLSLAIKRGDELTVTVEGGDEDAAAAAIERFLREKL
ncbi:MAG: HPr family phosphocarrier protein [Clostridiales bacterium]|nr:HPr family phosphocarrier protein [Clostridiales bacterium]